LSGDYHHQHGDDVEGGDLRTISSRMSDIMVFSMRIARK